MRRRGLFRGNSEILPLLLSHASTTSVNLRIETSDTLPIDVIWADGSTGTLPGNANYTTKTYSVSTIGNIEILTPERVRTLYSTAGALNFDVAVLKDYSISIIQITTSVNALTGNVADLPSGLEILYIAGQNTVSGNVADLPLGLTQIIIQGQNTLTGNIANLPSGVTTMILAGQNTVSGDIGNAPAGLTSISLQGQNTVSGNISGIKAALQSLTIQGQNTVAGDLANLPSNVTYLYATGQNTIGTYTAGKTWVNPNYFWLRPKAGFGLSSAAVDNLLIDLAAATWSGGGRAVNLLGNNAARTAASASAVTTLQGKSVTVTTNI